MTAVAIHAKAEHPRPLARAEAENLLGAGLSELGRFEEADSLLTKSIQVIGASKETPIPTKREDWGRLVRHYEAWSKPARADEARNAEPASGPARFRFAGRHRGRVQRGGHALALCTFALALPDVGGFWAPRPLEFAILLLRPRSFRGRDDSSRTDLGRRRGPITCSQRPELEPTYAGASLACRRA